MLQVAVPSADELEKSSQVLVTSLSKLDSALNNDFESPTKLFGSQNDNKFVMCKEIQESLPSQSYDQIPSKNFKNANDKMNLFDDEIADEDDKMNLFNNEIADEDEDDKTNLFNIFDNEIFDEDDKMNLFDNDSKDIKPIKDCMQKQTCVMFQVPNSIQMLEYVIDTKDYSNKMETFTSNNNIVSPSKGHANVFSVPKLTNVGIEQFQTPLPSHRPLKIPKLESYTNLSNNHMGNRHYMTMKSRTFDRNATGGEIYNHSNPTFEHSVSMFKSKFHPTPDMRLTLPEIKVCAYVFYPDNQPREVLLRNGGSFATTGDIECLCPGRVIEDKDDVLQGLSVKQLLKLYAENWMQPFLNLKYIYLPIKDKRHWYLMVISLEERIVHHLDSCLQVTDVMQRHETIRTMLNENAVRMKAALDLLLGSYNECKEWLEAIAEIFWSALMFSGAH
ncbi:hypothetical protein RJT34_07379 [Clitoria ternatea]|uniref:Ubiquitin-like protease family profile domain-containing protein n=1 Tax=Clitoria ternatea TaxID=43366 RepID=A0AAN9K6I3_CLITE